MKVVIIQRRLTHYRVPLFECMKKDLSKHNIELSLIYGNPTRNEEKKNDSGYISWGTRVKNKYFSILGRTVCWIPFKKVMSEADLIIITQENLIISNFLVLMLRIFNTKVAFWGHGANFQTKNKNSLSERFKKYTNRYVDWWFAYTDLSVRLVEKTGFSKDKITNLENAVDISNLKELLLSEKNNGDNFDKCSRALFIGSLYSGKKLNFLLESSVKIQKILPYYKLVIIGDGPDKNQVTEFSNKYSWCEYLGFKDTKEKAKYLAEADVILNPGLVGLSILDSFAAGVPLITTNCGLHSPEIAYLKNGENGIITENTIDDYVKSVLNYFEDESYRKKLENGAALSANHYTIQNMAENFVDGILDILNMRSRK